jgi:hypothetical protein
MLDAAKQIREVAYQLWEKEGRPAGCEHSHWLEAERIVFGSGQDAATAASPAKTGKKPARKVANESPRRRKSD